MLSDAKPPSETERRSSSHETSTSAKTSLDANTLEKGGNSTSPEPDGFDSSETLRESETFVSWDGPNDPDNPRNWSKKQRWTVTLVVSLFTFISPVGSSISSPSLPAISRELNIAPGSILENMTLSIFVLAYALGPLIWGPLSELFGRLPILQISNIWFLIFNTLCPFAKTPTQMLVFRFLAGFGGAAPQSIGGGVVGDLWSPEERGMAMSVYSLAPLVGPSTGPLVGGWIALKSRWQWVFWSVSIADAILQIAGFIFLRETYAPQLLKRKAQSLRKETGKSNIRSAFEATDRHWPAVMGRGIAKPLKFLATEPIVQVFALYMAVLYGVLYLSLTTFVKVFTDQYGQNSGIAGLHYLAIALGSTVGGQVGARVLNKIYRKLKARNGGVGTPEMRCQLDNDSVYRAAFQVDNYALYAASAIAGVSSFRAFAGFGFPLFADKMYAKLGDGWGNSILALICLVIGCPSPFIFYRYGPRLRAWSKAASLEQ
ncbi:hypothetical protein V5O48_004441 [Marasmius crinis-equi]|uniref:Major facilitator superfamily (MFS) profile domain-containing protein n=1 Tax=Marasmius crinis-equi TaxID=585013 RepID=A0ABR3FQ31_9AGAR